MFLNIQLFLFLSIDVQSWSTIDVYFQAHADAISEVHLNLKRYEKGQFNGTFWLALALKRVITNLVKSFKILIAYQEVHLQYTNYLRRKTKGYCEENFFY